MSYPLTGKGMYVNWSHTLWNHNIQRNVRGVCVDVFAGIIYDLYFYRRVYF